MEHVAEMWLVDLRQAWPVLLARAVFALAFGLVALIWPTITLLILAWAFGVYANMTGCEVELGPPRDVLRTHRHGTAAP
jgi:uncharacterized membrane protein HdeD (DUF308 family)